MFEKLKDFILGKEPKVKVFKPRLRKSKIGKRRYLVKGELQSETILDICEEWGTPLSIIGTKPGKKYFETDLLVNKISTLVGKGNS